MVLLDLENVLIDVLPGLSMPAGAASFVFARIEWIQAFFWRKRKPEKEKEENIWRRSLKDNEKSRFRSRDFCQFLEGFGIGFGEFGLGKKVSVSENLVSEKSLGIGFGIFGIGKKVSVSVSENLVSEKKSWYRFRSKFWYLHSVIQRWQIWGWSVTLFGGYSYDVGSAAIGVQHTEVPNLPRSGL